LIRLERGDVGGDLDHLWFAERDVRVHRIDVLEINSKIAFYPPNPMSEGMSLPPVTEIDM
jgi:hypothetical protein